MRMERHAAEDAQEFLDSNFTVGRWHGARSRDREIKGGTGLTATTNRAHDCRIEFMAEKISPIPQ